MGDLVGVSWVEEEAGVRSGLSCGPTSKAQPPRSKAPRPQRLGCHSSWASHQAFYFSSATAVAHSPLQSHAPIATTLEEHLTDHAVDNYCCPGSLLRGGGWKGSRSSYRT